MPNNSVKSIDAKMDDTAQSNTAQVAIKEIKFGSNTFKLIRPFNIGTDKSFSREFFGGIKFIEKTDICMRALSIGNINGIITGEYDLHLVKNLIT